MANEQEQEPTDAQIESIKKAMVSAGVLKSVSLSKADEEKIREALAREGIDTLARNWRIICSRAHWCLVIAK